MKTFIHFQFAAILSIAAFVAAFTADAQATVGSNIIPLIVMDDVPLTDAIKNLARQANFNYILDPRLAGSGQQPDVTGRWENMTPRQLLTNLLAEHNLVLVENPATSVSRITFTNQTAKPVATDQIVGDATVIPLIVMDDVPLTDAIKNLARQAKLDYSFDPKVNLAQSPPGSTDVTVRWENISAAQALAALLDNYDLALVKDSASNSYRVVPKERKEPAPEPAKK